EGAGEVAADQVVLLARGLAGVHEVGPPGDAGDGLRERLVRRHPGGAEAGDADLVPQRLRERLTEAERDVLDRRVGVDGGGAGRAGRAVDQGVLAERGEHVVVERHRGADLGRPRAVEVELDEHGGLARAPLDARGAVLRGLDRAQLRLGHATVTSVNASRNAASPSGVPMLSRRYCSGPVSRIRTPLSSRPCQTDRRSANVPNSTKLASESTATNPRSRSHATQA